MNSVAAGETNPQEATDGGQATSSPVVPVTTDASELFVHVVSGADHAQTALSLGAIGYAIKPVRPEELVAVFSGLERRLAPGVRRVLVVEDDAVQREAISRLLAAPDNPGEAREIERILPKLESVAA